MKWVIENVTFERGNMRPCIAKFDNSICWFTPDVMCSTTTFRQLIRKLANQYGAKTVQVQYAYDDLYNATEKDVVEFLEIDGNYIFRNELPVPDGHRRQFVTYINEALFT